MSPNQQQVKPQSPVLVAVRRSLWVGAVLGLLLILCWACGGCTLLLHHRIERALAARDEETAEDSLVWLKRLQCDNAETAFWEARLRRKQLRVAEVPQWLELADKGGFDRERIAREAILLEAQTGQLPQVVRRLNEMMVDPQGDGADICEAYVNGALIAGANDLALKILPVWKAEFPADPQPYYANARLLEYQGKIDEAEIELRTALRKSPRHWPALYALGRILADRHQFEAALVEFDQAANMRHNAAPLYQRAKCLHALGKTAEARVILLELAARSELEIRRSFDRVTEPQRGLPIPLELGNVEATLENYSAAVQWFNSVIADDPKNLDARYTRGMALRALQRTEEADRDLAEVQRVRSLLKEVDVLVDEINNAPTEPNLEKRCRIGELFIKHENGRRGEFWLRDVLNRSPQYGPAHQLLADYYAELALRDPHFADLAERHRRAVAVPPVPASPQTPMKPTAEPSVKPAN